MEPNQKKQLLYLGGLLVVLVAVVGVFVVPAMRQKPAAAPPSKTAETATPGATGAVPAPGPGGVAAQATTGVEQVVEVPAPPVQYTGREPFRQPSMAPPRPTARAGEATMAEAERAAPGVTAPRRAGAPMRLPMTPPPLLDQLIGPLQPGQEPMVYYPVVTPLRIEPYMPVAQRPQPPSAPSVQWTVTGVVVGPKRTAILNDGERSYIVEQGGVVKKVAGAEVVAEEIGADYVRLRYRNRIVTLKLREGS